MKLIIVSGRSGSGKTSALQALEDAGYYCVDNLPVSIISNLYHTLYQEKIKKMAVSIDSRNVLGTLDAFNILVKNIKEKNIHYKIIYLDANNHTLIKRFSATRRKHPLTSAVCSLAEAIEQESKLLSPIQSLAHLRIDTSLLSVHQIRARIQTEYIHNALKNPSFNMTVLLQSFGFKHGTPIDADFIFDVRCLPNPYWSASLRKFNGLDDQIIQFMQSEPLVQKMSDDILSFCTNWLSHFVSSNRYYLTIAIGCTGGQHRSIYMIETLKKQLDNQFHIQVRHRELENL